MERVFMTWVPFSSRSQLLSDAFNARPYYITYLRKRTLFRTLIRYFLATFHTLYVLCRSKPTLIFSMNEPVFLPMVVFCYSKLAKSRYVLDSHSGLLKRQIWKPFIPIMKPIYRCCLLNIAHNNYDADIHRTWGARTEVLGTEIYPYGHYEKRPLETTNNVVVIGKFGVDEPTEEILSAATSVPEAHFYFTGPLEKARKKIGTRNLPKNIILTGFLPREEFIGLIKAADVAMVLVTTDNTMQMGAWEAMSCDTPVILSDWELLRLTFPKGAVFVQNTKQSIECGIREFFSNREVLERDIAQLRIEKKALWNKEINAIEDRLKSYERK